MPGRGGERRRYGRLARWERRAVGVDVRVLDRVQVDRASVRVLRPAARALDRTAVESRRVVRLDRAEVAAAVGVDRHHPADREPRRVKPPEHARDDRCATSRCTIRRPGAHRPVEAPVARADEPELVEPDRAARSPRDAGHRRAERGRERRHGGAKRRARRRGVRCAGRGEHRDDEADTKRHR